MLALLNTTALTTSAMRGIFSPTPTELAMGRILRAPDHSAADGDGGNGGAPDDAGQSSDSGADDGDTGSLIGDAKSDAGAGGEGADGDAKVPDGAGDTGKDGENDDGKDGDGDDAAAAAAAKADAEVPEAYKLEPITIGEGEAAQTVEIDNKLLEDVTPLLRDAGVTLGAAKKLAPAVLKVQEQVLTRLNNDHKAMRADWEKQVREDKDLGGAKLDTTLSLVDRALGKFGAPSVKDEQGKETNEFRLLMNETGLGDHPVLVRMFSEIGKLVGEDGELIRPDTSPALKLDRLEALYPDDVPKK
jgi:hypothetical protein